MAQQSINKLHSVIFLYFCFHTIKYITQFLEILHNLENFIPFYYFTF